MGRKMGLLGILIAILLYFAAGMITAYFISMIDAHLPQSIPLRDYVLTGLASLLGFLYWLLVIRVAGKSIKKMILG